MKKFYRFNAFTGHPGPNNRVAVCVSVSLLVIGLYVTLSYRQTRLTREIIEDCEIPKRLPNYCWKLPSISSADDIPLVRNSARRRELNELGKSGQLVSDDARIISYLFDNCDALLRPPNGIPSNGGPTLRKIYGNKSPSMGQDVVVRRILRNMKGGFFVECGGYDGIISSNTFVLETKLGWQGLLLEPDPSNLRNLHVNHRNSWISHSCLAVHKYPHEVIFKPNNDAGRISQVIASGVVAQNAVKRKNENSEILVQCFPLWSFLAALEVEVVDYLSLDVEGDELSILKTIPFDKVLIKVITVEIITSPETQEPCKAFMESKGYTTLGLFYWGKQPFDLVFVHNSTDYDPSVFELLNKPDPFLGP